ncbi:MAG: TRM11 family SAM-dependent methyltransferase [Candidatus Poribacteria bacterium]
MSENCFEYYQVFFRTKSGGRGVDYNTAKAEFLSVYRKYTIQILLDLPAKMRFHVVIPDISSDQVADLAKRLGYTYGILKVKEEPYLGGELYAKNTARWVVGTIRIGDKKLHLMEIYRQNEKERLENSPNQRTFLIEKDGIIKEAKGYRRKRAVAPNDAKFIINVSELNENEIIIDPFAGTGGLLIECLSRRIKAFASDIDPVVRPGLAKLTDNRFTIADAQNLPFKNNIFDAVITEPPFGSKHRQNVLNSLPEICRIIKQDGKIVLLIAQDMYDSIKDYMVENGFSIKYDFTLRRHGKLISRVIRFEKNKTI